LRGKLITNAPSYLTGNVLLGATQGAATAYAQMQTTNQTSSFGSTSSTVTGSPVKYVEGQAGTNAANQAQQWWHDREENSFDAIYVPSGQEIVVNFAKQIDIDYNPQGRKLEYAQNNLYANTVRSLD
jgi:integrating conjugative element protein (TIGR03752 family)